MALIKLTENISYLESSEKPLSSEVIFIKTDKSTWIFDVGLNNEAYKEIKKIQGPKNIVISHFHPDHIMNLARISCKNLYLSKNTKKYTLRGNVISESMEIDENPKITIREFPSSHAKGSLILICQDYAFLGDGPYAKPVRGHHSYNAQLLLEMIKVMEELDVKYFCLDHDKNFIQSKEEVINRYKEIYKNYHKPDSPIIDVEDFFNPDGKVKEDPPIK
ncbi:MAG: MBL fold metallo-hydrolase [Treponema sp.]|nr:MBL fold metallo-hydrolase [Treponema sp.]